MSAGKLVNAGFIAGDIEPTGNGGPLTGHQFRMHGADVTIYIRPETARQWIAALTPIAESENNA